MWTAGSLADDLRALGLTYGDTVLVHSSLRAVGPVTGGCAAVVAAFQSVLGSEGTLVVPAFTEHNSTTSRAHRAQVQGLEVSQVAAFRAAMPPFDPMRSAATTGCLAEEVRTMPGALRSAHPQTSFVAFGAKARAITEGHAADCHLGEQSPLRRLVDVSGRVLLVGVGYEACTVLHLTEYRVPAPPMRRYECVVQDEGGKPWWAFESVDLDDNDFPLPGSALDAVPGMVVTGTFGAARARLLDAGAAVRFAVQWFVGNRRYPRTDPGD